MTDTVETGTAAAIYAEHVVRSLCVAYASAVNASDSLAYSKLFTEDAIRMPPGTEPERGREKIRRGEQADYDHARLNIRSTPVDAIQVADGWVYGIAQVDGTATSHSDGSTSAFRATKAWLLQREPSGQWLIAR
ncbi:MAG: DUF4440 domain-containing protein, partial [Actinomycetota bacterium]|nr:DUF4440 domain-containing protein [Actinomycetota bacterium]